MNSTQRATNVFRKRFERRGDAYVYWMKEYRQGYIVCEAEMNTFITNYYESLLPLRYLVNGWTWLGLGSFACLLVSRLTPLNGWIVLGVFTAVATLLIALHWRTAKVPDRLLSQRQRYTFSPSLHVRLQRGFGNSTWQSLVWSALGVALIACNAVARFDRTSSFDWFILVLACIAAVISLAALLIRCALALWPAETRAP